MRTWAKAALISLAVVAAAGGGFVAATLLNAPDEPPDVCVAVFETSSLLNGGAAFASRFEAAVPGVVTAEQLAAAQGELDVPAQSYRDLADQVEDLRATYLVREDNPVAFDALTVGLRMRAARFDAHAAFYEHYAFVANRYRRPPMFLTDTDLDRANALPVNFDELASAVDIQYLEALWRQCGLD